MNSISSNNVYSLCIPRVSLNINEMQIRNIFDELNMGIIQRIDIVNKTTEKGEKFNRVFIHFESWFETENAILALERLNNGKEIKIMYDEPWFWRAAPSYIKKDFVDKIKKYPRNKIK